MSKFCVNSHALRAFSLSLAFAVVLFCFSGFFSCARADYTDESFKEIMIVILDSWGVNFRKSSEDETSIMEYYDELMTEFLEDSEILQDDFFAPFQYGIDKFGNLIANNYLVQGCIDFVNWLTGKYDLQDNSSVNVHPGNGLTFGDFTCYPVPFVSMAQRDPPYDYLYQYLGVTSTSSDLVYCIFYQNINPSSFQVLTFSYTTTPYTATVNHSSSFQPNNPSYNSWAFSSYHQAGSFYIGISRTVGASNYGKVLPSLAPYAPDQFWIDYFTNYSGPLPTGENPFYIDTRVIDIPTITPSDGIQVSVPGTNWGDTISDVLDLIERLLILYDDTQLGVNSVIGILADLIENLQDYVDIQQDFVLLSPDLSDTSIPSDSAWSVVSGVFDSFSDGLSLLSFLVFSLPSAFWVLFTAIFCFIFIYAFIKMGRDSH